MRKISLLIILVTPIIIISNSNAGFFSYLKKGADGIKSAIKGTGSFGANVSAGVVAGVIYAKISIDSVSME